jgi:hypothetical protein
MNRMRVLRWALVPVAAAAAWSASFFVGLLLLDAVGRLCPKSQIVSGLCIAPWWPYAEAAVFCVSAAIAAASIVIASSLTAPLHRARVAAVVYAAGVVWAVWVVEGLPGDDEYLPFASAIVAGGWAVWWITARFGSEQRSRTRTEPEHELRTKNPEV